MNCPQIDPGLPHEQKNRHKKKRDRLTPRERSQQSPHCFIFSFFRFLLFYRLKIVLPHAAKRTNPIGRYIFKRRPRCYSAIRIPHCRVVNVATNCTNILFHHFRSCFDTAKITRFFDSTNISEEKKQPQIQNNNHCPLSFSVFLHLIIIQFLYIHKVNRK